MKELKQMGKGNHLKASEAFTTDKLIKLVKRKVLSTSKTLYTCLEVSNISKFV